MALSDSNTFVLPSGSRSLRNARADWNKSLRAILSNFNSPGAPGSENLVIEGAAESPKSGLLYRSSLTNALYIYDTVRNKNNPVYGNFTRIGVWNRSEVSLSAANLQTYEASELMVIAGSNAGIYTKGDNAGTIVDLGLAPLNSIVSTMLVDNTVPNTKIQAGAITGPKIAANAISSNSKIANYSINYNRFENGPANSFIKFATNGAATACAISYLSVFTKEWISADIPVAPTANHVAHTLGVRPKYITATLRCLTAEQGYNANDIVMLRTHSDGGGGSGIGGCSLSPNTTHIYVKFPSTTGRFFLIKWEDTSTGFSITAARWVLNLKAWA